VIGAQVADNTVNLADMVGVDVHATISFALGANSCGPLTLGIAGAQPGQAVLMSFTNAVPTPGMVLGPMRVSAPDVITGQACNVAAATITAIDLGIRVVTFG
jgi:hypothetical protein